MVLEAACRSRAVTTHQMRTFREAWAGVASILIVDPVILPTSNNKAAAPFDMLYSAFPMMTWTQPRNNWRAVVMTQKYLTVQFARELAPLLGCSEEQALPGLEFLADALRSPPLYFEAGDSTQRGLCCVCYKGGCLGRCPNPQCGLLMHFACVTPSQVNLSRLRRRSTGKKRT